MKQLLAILVFVFATVQAQVPGPLDTSFWAEAAGAQTIPPPTSYIVQQTFESTTSDGWIISGNNINTDYAVNPLEGTESCLGNNPSVFSYIYTNFAGFDAKITEGYFKFEFEAVSFDSVASFTISTVNTNDACAATITTGGKLQGDQGSATLDGGTSLILATHYWVWGHFKCSTTVSPGNGICDLWLNTSDSKPALTEVHVTTGTGPNGGNACSLSWASGGDCKFDNIKVALTPFE